MTLPIVERDDAVASPLPTWFKRTSVEFPFGSAFVVTRTESPEIRWHIELRIGDKKKSSANPEKLQDVLFILGIIRYMAGIFSCPVSFKGVTAAEGQELHAALACFSRPENLSEAFAGNHYATVRALLKEICDIPPIPYRHSIEAKGTGVRRRWSIIREDTGAALRLDHPSQAAAFAAMYHNPKQGRYGCELNLSKAAEYFPPGMFSGMI